ncbi:AAA family ATPase [Parachlamydia sp. AcF125]|uniref:AAA family ATPase n=1 Tax=Parachlamydia sp. AcF125 TaxID=2795736 RepID=UPI001BC95927|nr:AAA family ATPase [Parachlamydia sp. AcF125]MBS4168342.1 putative protein YhaN [Parachlamydia sp. AcF125]
MKLHYLNIRRMPGFLQQGLRYTQEHLANAHIHVVIGGNGAGKTTTCKAIRALLWPSLSHSLEPLSLHSVWMEEDQKIEISLEGKHWKCIPHAELQKQLPPPAYASCYTLTIDDLFSSATDQNFAAEIAKQARGGYDLSLVKNHPFFTIGRFKGRSEKQELDLALKSLRLAKEHQKTLKQEEDSLFKIEQEIEAASHSQALLPFLEDALRWKALDELIKALTNQLSHYPSQLEKFKENDREIYQQFHTQKQEYDRRLSKTQSEVAKKQQFLHSLPFSHLDLPSSQTLEHIQSLLEHLKKAQEEKNRVEQALTQANQILHKYLTFAHLPNIPPFTLEEVSHVQQLMQEYEKLSLKRDILQTRLHVLNSHSSPYPLEKLREGIALLNLWGTTPSSPSIFHWITCSMILFLSLFFLFIPLLSNFPWKWALTGSACGLATLLLWIWKPPYSLANQNKIGFQNQYKALNLPLPDKWSAEQVRPILNEVEGHYGKALRYQEDTSLRDELLFYEKNLENQWDQTVSALKQFSFENEQNVSYPVLYECIKSILLTQIEIENSQQQAASYRQNEKRILEELGSFFRFFAQEEPTPHASAWQIFLDIRHQVEQIQACQNHLSHLQEQLNHLKQDRDSLEENIHAFYKRCGCSSEEQFLECLDRFPNYHQLLQTYQHKQIEAEVLKQRLLLHPHLLNLSHAELLNMQQASLLSAKNLEPLIEKKTAIKQALQLAENAYQMENAQMNVLEKQTKFEQSFEEFGLGIAGQFLLDKIESDYQRDSQPEVFSIANEWFSRFTKAHYSLVVPEQTPSGFEFLAYDTKSCESKKLHELSRGTQSQLILAVRLAFNLFIEKEKKPLPYFLDETLSGSDSERFHEIARSLCEIAATGRQIFYFTCREADVYAWEHVISSYGNLRFSRIPLSSMQTLEKMIPLPVKAEIRKPASKETLAEYARSFPISPILPHLGKGHVHVYHLLEEAEELYYLQYLQIHTYGQLKQQMELGKIQGCFGNEKSWKKITSKGSILEHFFDYWHVGRGKAIDAEILTRSGVSDKYLSSLLEIAKQTQYSSSALIEILSAKQDERLKGFRQQSLSKLKEALIEEGYLDTRPPLSPQNFQIQLLQIATPYIQADILSLDETTCFIDKLKESLKLNTSSLVSD